jgi:hypothetical protein
VCSRSGAAISVALRGLLILSFGAVSYEPSFCGVHQVQVGSVTGGTVRSFLKDAITLGEVSVWVFVLERSASPRVGGRAGLR